MRVFAVILLALSALAARGESGCRLAVRAAESREKAALNLEGQWKCRRLVSVRDRLHRGRADLPYRGTVRAPEACVVAYTVAGDPRPHGWFVDRANQISNELIAQNHGGKVNFIGKDTNWYVLPLSNNYHVYSFSEETAQLGVSQQVIGIGRFNRFDYSVACEK